jgi:hypothetical protein
MEELFNVALVIMYGFINPEIEQSKNEIKAEISSPKSNDNNVWKRIIDDNLNKKLSKKEETSNLENVANTEPSF